MPQTCSHGGVPRCYYLQIVQTQRNVDFVIFPLPLLCAAAPLFSDAGLPGSTAPCRLPKVAPNWSISELSQGVLSIVHWAFCSVRHCCISQLRGQAQYVKMSGLFGEEAAARRQQKVLEELRVCVDFMRARG